MKDALGGKTTKKIFTLKTKLQLIDADSKNKKVKSTKKYVIKTKLNLKIIKISQKQNFLEATQLENKITYLKKSKLTQIVLRKMIINS